jgi:hypothetical protein
MLLHQLRRKITISRNSFVDSSVNNALSQRFLRSFISSMRSSSVPVQTNLCG